MAEKVAKFRFSGYKITDGHIQIDPDRIANKQLNVTFDKTAGVNDGERKMRLLLVAKIVDDNNVINIQVKAEGYFEFDGDLSEEERSVFFNTSAPAILFPYVRAYISTLSSLSGITPVILPTLNLSNR